MDATSAANQDAETSDLITAAVGDRCTNCQAPFASDQRYCVNCGERRGKARFSFASLTAPAQAAPVSGAAAPRTAPPRRPRASASFTFVAGVGTLLLAMGVGVLIGHNNSPATVQRASSPPVQVVTVGGGGGSGGAASAAATRKASKTLKTPKIKISKKTTQAAAAAAGKVLGASAKNLPPPTVTVGAKGHGPGYQQGHFTGNFFGQ